LAAIRALDQKVGLSWKCGTEVVHQTREVAGRAPASSQRISMAGIVHPPAPDEDEEHPGGVIMRNMPGRAGSDAKAKASSCIAPATKPRSTVSSLGPPVRRGRLALRGLHGAASVVRPVVILITGWLLALG
jgi:hypothetical protein